MKIEQVVGKKSLLNLITEGVNGWHMAYCPEFNVMAWGHEPEKTKQNLHSMIISNSHVFINRKKGVSPILRQHSREVLKHEENITPLFKK